MTRSRIDWLACSVLIAALAGCGNSKSPEESKPSHATKGEDSDTDAGPADSGSSTTGESNAGSTSGPKAGGSKSEAGSGGKGGAGGTGGTGGAKAESSSSDLPTDGNQLSLCSMAQGDCNKGLACSGSANALAESRDYCSKICETDDDCAGVTPSSAKYTCSTGRGIKLCEIACTGSDDTSCPRNMKCVQTGTTRAAMGGEGGSDAGAADRGNPFVPVYHCKYPLVTSSLWGPCQDGEHQCDEEATCFGTGVDRAGVCTKSCTMDSDCSEKPSSGSITPSCATISSGRGNMTETKLCVLSCLDKKDGCPDGTTCVEGPPASMGRGMGRGRGMGNADAGMASEPSFARCE